MPAKPKPKIEYKHRYVDCDNRPPPNDDEYEVYTCVLNVGGGIRRPFFAEYLCSLNDPPGPMARHVVRVTDRTLRYRDYDEEEAVDHEDPPGIVGYRLERGDYVVYAQEIVDVTVIAD